ncbi:RNA polymerase sigma factor [Sulfitobacter sp. 20_GPM-1509m]|uniref:RNA polymerase sigma factor n=1 Tax=Sulfitobacter sp. 20_GPM-1509m TaxID=1380367 RepID=UPI00048CC432|nr:sigma-70 family RNA polymerase sigma factor [Sulfitobacter sp. 20_GPM-1509m]
MRIFDTLRAARTGPKPRSDEALLADIAKGDVSALEELHRKYFPKLMHFARRITDNAESAEEVANDALMTVWRTADRFEGRSKPSSWIFGIAYRMALRQREKIGKRKGDVELDEGLVADDSNTETAVMHKKDLAAALLKLTPELRAVVELTYYNGYLYTEIADILECPVGTVKTRMMTARKRLREMLSDEALESSENAVA